MLCWVCLGWGCTYAGAREAFDDPTFLLGFECFDLLLDEIDDDVVRHVRVCAPLIDDSLSVLAFLADFLVEEIADGDAVHVEDVAHGECVLLAPTAGRAHDDDARDWR